MTAVMNDLDGLQRRLVNMNEQPAAGGFLQQLLSPLQLLIDVCHPLPFCGVSGYHTSSLGITRFEAENAGVGDVWSCPSFSMSTAELDCFIPYVPPSAPCRTDCKPPSMNVLNAIHLHRIPSCLQHICTLLVLQACTGSTIMKVE